ncbi:hypothetical protein [Erythrobacter aureus]|uniref:Uncharacterized protein n=1 Tax=Erythrobacter aureus TaxID=2182384 RepID=A0A345YIW6_9SPHN|nr:hypothetical protein [Erythrobacter aureus]AXK43868.1 hypothetical protein DVR09_15550 [Erythrobacter aureus]
MASAGLLEKPDTLRAVFERIDSGDQGADVAFNVADKAMRAAGVRWSDLLEAYLKPNTASSKDAFANAFEGIFGGFEGFETPMKHEQDPTPPVDTARAAPRRRQIFQGLDVPGEISGIIKVEYRQNVRTGEMLVVTVQNEEAICGPLVIFDEADIKLFDENPNATFYAHVTKPRQSRHNPKISKLQLV